MLAAAVALLVPGTSAAAPSEPLGHAGRWITDAKGRVVVLHGAAVVVGGGFGVGAGAEQTAEQVGFARADAEFLAEQGFNVVRLGMFFRGYSPDPGGYDDAYLESFLRTHRQLADAGIFTLVDFHQDQLGPPYNGRGFPDWFLLDDGLPNPAQPFPQGYFANPALNRAYDNLWANVPGPGGVGLQDRFAEGWRRVAARFAGEERVLGYDIFNEPWPGSDYATCANPAGCPPGGFDQTRLTDFSNRVIAAIRAGDPDRLAFYEPNLQFDVGAATAHGRVEDPNAGFSFHNYCLGAAPGLPAVPDPFGLCEGVGETLVFENADAHARQTGAALLLTEFGDTEDPAIHARVADLADRFMVGWTNWAYMGSTGQIKIDSAAPPSPENIRRERLAAVVRAYPKLVSGTPRSYSFEDGRFELQFTTRSAAALGNAPVGGGGGPPRFGAGARSEIAVPAPAFPRGYGVELEDARVVSPAGAALLVIRACAGADLVRVRVAPGIGPPRGCGEQRGGACLFSERGTRGPDRLRGGPGGDRLLGRGGGDRLAGGRGRDCLLGGRGDDRVSGGPGGDRLQGGAGSDRLRGSDGADRVRGGAGADRIDAVGGGVDRVRCGPGKRDLARLDERDRARGCERRTRP